MHEDGEEAIGFVAEGVCPLCEVAFNLHDGQACCPCCGDVYKVTDHRLEVRQCPEHGRHCDHWRAAWAVWPAIVEP